MRTVRRGLYSLTLAGVFGSLAIGVFDVPAGLLDSNIQAAEVQDLLKTIQAVGPKGAGSVAAAKAWDQLTEVDATQLPTILAALDEASPLAANWLRGAVDAIAERTVADGQALPAKSLEAFVLDTKHTPRARRTAFEWLAKIDDTAADRLIPKMLHDPGVEFRRDAVVRLVSEAEATKDAAQQKALYQKAFAGSRDLDQVKLLVERLKKLEVDVDLPKHFGFLQHWYLIGPFDNVGGKGYQATYPPEKQVKLDADYQGTTDDRIRWREHTGKDDYGAVDLNELLGKHKGAVAYAATFFESDRDRPVQFRMTSSNATRLWLNGKLVDQHEVYHSGSNHDQYVADATLKKGRNVILLKVCQNEQEESWAQDWKFQIRVCDTAGTAVLSKK